MKERAEYFRAGVKSQHLSVRNCICIKKKGPRARKDGGQPACLIS